MAGRVKFKFSIASGGSHGPPPAISNFPTNRHSPADSHLPSNRDTQAS